MNIFKNSKTPAEEFQSLCDREISLTKERTVIAGRIAAAEQSAAEAYLSSESAAVGPEVDLIGRLQNQVIAIDRAIALLRRNRPTVILAEAKYAAERLRGEAAQKSRELGALAEKTQKVLGQLGELQGINYGPEILVSQPGPFEYQQPKFRKIEAEILVLETKACDLEAKNERNIPESGSIDLESVTSTEEVLQAMLQHRGMSPTAAAVLAFLQSVEDTAKANRHVEFGVLPRRVYIAWDRDGISRDRSYVYVGELAKPLVSNRSAADGIRQEPGFNIASATFKAPPRELSVAEAREWRAA